MSTRSPALAAGRDDDAERPAIAPFWHRLNSYFLVPFQMEPLIYAALLALASYLLFLPGMLALLDRWVLPRDLRRRLYPPKAPKAPKAPKPPKAARASWP